MSRPRKRRSEDYRMQILAEFVKLKPPKFEGQPDPLAAERWLKAIKEMFNTTRVKPKYWVGFATYLFEGSAENWLESKENDCDIENFSWREFERLFRETYIPDGMSKPMMLTELRILGQSHMKVADYYARFIELSRHDPVMMADPVLRCNKFRRSLKKRIRSKLAPFKFTDIDKLFTAAQLVEADLEQSDGAHKLSKETLENLVDKEEGKPSYKIFRCHACRQVGHRIRDCPQNQSKSPPDAGEQLKSKSSSSPSSSGHFIRYSRSFAELQSQDDFEGQLRGQSNSLFMATQSSGTGAQPAGLQYQNAPLPYLASTPQQSQNVAFNPQCGGIGYSFGQG